VLKFIEIPVKCLPQELATAAAAAAEAVGSLRAIETLVLSCCCC